MSKVLACFNSQLANARLQILVEKWYRERGGTPLRNAVCRGWWGPVLRWKAGIWVDLGKVRVSFTIAKIQASGRKVPGLLVG